ncbi:Uncharacterised protein [Ectopseudomonas mendocina]|uniref:Uncharacterized protein n=1 Tax=Ectopseudomonas mendocina TaxID=300 RepID=A0A379INI5_ECTME|nr:Uncharacterised protein [Pseudomonas mendocina]
MVKPSFCPNATTTVLVATTLLNCMTLKPSSRATFAGEMRYLLATRALLAEQAQQPC